MLSFRRNGGSNFTQKKEHFWPLIDLTSDDCQSSCRRNEIKEIQKKNKGRRWRRGPPGGTGVGHREPRPITTRHIFTEFCVCVFYFLVSPPLRNACDVTEMASVFCFVFFWRRFRRRSVSGRHRSGNAGRFSPSLSLSLSLCLLGRFTELFTEFFRCGTVHGRGRRVGRFTGVSLSLSLSLGLRHVLLCAPATYGWTLTASVLPRSSIWCLGSGWPSDRRRLRRRGPHQRHTHTQRERERERDGDEIMATVDTHDAGTQTSTPHHNKGATRRQRRRRASQEAEESGAAHTGPVTDDMQKTHTHTHTHTHPTLDWDSTVTRRPRFSAATMQLGRATAEDSTAAAANRPSNASETVTNGGSSPHRHTHTQTAAARSFLNLNAI